MWHVQVAELYKAQRQHPTWARNGAPFSGAVNWCRGLRERISGPSQHPRSTQLVLLCVPATLPPKVPLTAGPMERVRGMRRAVVESEEGKEVTGLYERLAARLAAHEADTVAAWCHQLLETSDQKLKQPLLTCCACPPE